MDFNDPRLLRFRDHEPIMDPDDHDEFAALDSRASVVSSEWGNVSSSSSTSSPENQLSAKDIANWREFWEIWSNNHRLTTATTDSFANDPRLSGDIYAIFQLAHQIPRSWFSIHTSEHFPDRLREYLSQAAQTDSALFGENDFNLSLQPNSQDALALAANALEIYEAALRLSHDQLNRSLDEQWTEIHDALILRCARGHLLGVSEAWSLPSHILDLEESPFATRIMSVHKIRPHGALPILPQGEGLPSSHLSAAAFSTLSQITSHLRDIPEGISLYSFNTMATSAILTELSSFGIDMPVFGVLFDCNVVRFHIDWSVMPHDQAVRKIISLPLPGVNSPFRDFDLTRPDDVLRVTFILAGIHSYAENRLAPAVLASEWNTARKVSLNRSKVSVPFPQGEISSEEKVHAWMRSGAVDAVDDSNL